MKLIKFLPVLLMMPFIGWSSTTTTKAKAALTIQYTKTNVSCFGQANGKIEIAIYGGKMPYTIQWENGETATMIENLKSGSYKVQVVDQHGTMVEEIITVEMPSPLTLAYNSQQEYVVDALNGSMDVALTGGTPWDNNNAPFYFVRLNGKANFPDPHSLDDGTYKLTIEDARGCSMTVPVKIDFEEANAGPFSIEKVTQPGVITMTLYKPAQVSLMAAQ
jgi:hypothetical protein